MNQRKKTDLINKSVLLLNADRTILHSHSVKKILCMFLDDKVVILKTKGDTPLHPILPFNGIPVIAALKQYVFIPFIENRLTKKKILSRDNWTCQYCGRSLSSSTATVDHVLAKSTTKIPINSWENMVASCMKCNTKKGNKTLEECGMKLLRKPFKPNNKMHNIPNYLLDLYKKEYNAN